MKAKYKRFIAYLIDGIIVGIILALFTSSNLMKKPMAKYEDANERLTNYTEQILNGEVEINTETEKEFKSIVYDINSFGGAYNSINVIITIGYFAIFQYFNKGQTIGKKLMHIKVVSSNEKELSLLNYLIRTIIVYNTIFTITNMIGVEVFKINGFFKLYYVTSSFMTLLTFVTIFMVIYRNDERGLHDIISSTKVIDE